MSERETIRCRHCRLNQFVTANGNCRKCHQSMAPERVPDVQAVAIVAVPREPKSQPSTLVCEIGLAVKLVRLANMVSQWDLAKRMRCPRSYISKVENGRALPTIANLNRFAAALDATPYALIAIAEAA